MLERHAREQETKLEVSSAYKSDGAITSHLFSFQLKFERKRNRDFQNSEIIYVVPKNCAISQVFHLSVNDCLSLIIFAEISRKFVFSLSIS